MNNRFSFISVDFLKRYWKHNASTVYWLDRTLTLKEHLQFVKDILEHADACTCMAVNDKTVFIAAANNSRTVCIGVSSCRYYIMADTNSAAKILSIKAPPTIDWDAPIEYVDTSLGIPRYMGKRDEDQVWVDNSGIHTCANLRTGAFIDENDVPKLFGRNIINTDMSS